MSRRSRQLGFGPSDPRLLHFTDPEIINLFLHEAYGPRIDAGTEFFTITPLDANKRVIQTNVVAEGQKDQVSFYLTDLTRHLRGQAAGAAYFLLSHNHPSGNPAPSRHDFQMTEQIIKHFERFKGPRLLDHMITTATGRWSSIKKLRPLWWEWEIELEFPELYGKSK